MESVKGSLHSTNVIEREKKRNLAGSRDPSFLLHEGIPPQLENYE